MEKPSPGAPHVRLLAGGAYAAHRSLHGLRSPAWYALAEGDELVPLPDVQWADWDADGRLLVATRDGRLQIRGEDGAVAWQEDLRSMRPIRHRRRPTRTTGDPGQSRPTGRLDGR